MAVIVGKSSAFFKYVYNTGDKEFYTHIKEETLEIITKVNDVEVLFNIIDETTIEIPSVITGDKVNIEVISNILNANPVANLVAISEISTDPSGFDLRNPKTKGVLELCPIAADGIVYRIDENELFTKLTGQTTFGDGITPLTNKTFAQYPAVGETEFSFWNRGTKFVKEEIQILILGDIYNKQIITYDENGDIGFASSVYEAITEDTIVALVTGHPVEIKKVIFANERHGIEMSSSTHLTLHQTDGTKYASGLNINGLVNNGTTYTSIDMGVAWDEDLIMNYSGGTDSIFAYRTSGRGDWLTTDTPDNLLGLKNDNNDVVYNNYNTTTNEWELTPIGDDYVIMHFFFTNDAEFPIFKVLGQTLYKNRTEARRHLDSDVTLLKAGELPTPEFLHMYSIIIHNESNGQIETGLDKEIYADFRFGYPVQRYEGE